MKSISAIARDILELPLLKRELIEAANRKRTYVLRSAMAAILLVVFLLLFFDLRSYRNAYRMLGTGGEIAMVLVATNLFAIYILLPVMTCGAISGEREKQTLSLLLITRLSPARLVAEKLLSALLPLAQFMLITLPILGVAYLLGGITLKQTIGSVMILIMAAIQVASVAIFCSSLLRSGTTSFWAVYLTLAALALVPPCIAGILDELRLLPRIQIFPAYVPLREQLYIPFVAFLACIEMFQRDQGGLLDLMMIAWPPILVSTLMLVGSVFAVGRLHSEKGLANPNFKQILAGPIRFLAQKLRLSKLRGLATRIPQPWLQTIRRRLPTNTAIGNREIAATMLARWPLFAFLAGAFFVLTILMSHELRRASSWYEFFVGCEIFGTIVSLLMVASVASRMFAAERERQTLDSLLTTPVSNHELISEKQAATNRCILLIMGFFAYLVLLNFLGMMFRFMTPSGWFNIESQYRRFTYDQLGFLQSRIFIVVAMFLHLYLYLHIAKWIATGWGLYLHSQLKAMLASILSLLALSLGPVALLTIIMLAVDARPRTFPFWYFSSPAIVYGLTLVGELDDIIRDLGTEHAFAYWSVIFLNLILYFGVFWIIRVWVLRKFPAFLGRIDTQHTETPS
ncbi:MAG: ABC transporter permease [Planctomycetaceae bacterium]|nr:ABC transporter permease [Planctomycetaceae bacterium]